MRILLASACLLFVAAAQAQSDAIPDLKFTVNGFTVTGENPLTPAETQAVLEPYAGEYAGLEGLRAATDALEQAMASNGFSFHRAVLPPQTLDGGIVTLRVVTFGINEVRVINNSYFSDDAIRASLPVLTPGSPPNLLQVDRALQVANQHPRKALRVNFAQSEQVDAIDAVIDVQEQRPWQVFAGVNNIGTEETGYTRFTLGAQVANPLAKEHVITGTFTSSIDNFDDVSQYGLVYQAPIYRLSSWVTGFFVDSSVDIGGLQGVFDVAGAGRFYGVNFQHRMLPIGSYDHTVSIGIQDKEFDRSAAFISNGNVFAANKVRSRPLMLRYDGVYNWLRTAVSFYLEYAVNLSFGGFNRLQNYEAERNGATENWDAYHVGAAIIHRLENDWSIHGRLEGQYSGEPLIPGERFGIGGERSVRGFNERAVSGDDGLFASLELWTPPLNFLPGLRALSFVDFGYKHLQEPLDLASNQIASDTLASAGFGLRYDWEQHLVASFDWGINLQHADGEAAERGRNKWHINLQYRF